MATYDEHEEIIKALRVMLHNLISKNIIPCTEMDILNDKLTMERYELFMSYGIDLKIAVTCFPMDPIIPLIKLETNDNSFEVKKDAFNDKIVHVKTEIFEDDFGEDFLLDVKDEAPDTELGEVQDLNDPFDEGEDEDEDMPLASLPKKRKLEKEKIKTLFGGIKDNDDDYVPSEEEKDDPLPRVHKKSKVKSDGSKSKVDSGRFQIHQCSECGETFDRKIKFEDHKRNYHLFFEEVRYLYSKHNAFNDHGTFILYENFQKRKETLKNYFELQTPPPDFTREDFEQCKLPASLKDYVLTNLNAKMKRDKKVKNKVTFRCTSCKIIVKDKEHFQKHYLSSHRVKFTCPYEGCKYNKHLIKKETSIVRFARHFYYVSSIFR